MLNKNATFIRAALKKLKEKRILKEVVKLNPYHDEPKIYYYSGSSKSINNISSTGLSFDWPELALLRCLGRRLKEMSLVI